MHSTHDFGNLHQEYDVDSMIWYGRQLPSWFSETVTYYPFPNRNNGLKKSNHLQLNYQGKLYKMSNIPNVEFCSFGERGEIKLLLFFPKKIHQKEGFYVNVLTEIEYEELYNEIVLPTIIEVATRNKNYHVMNSFPYSYKSHANICRITGNQKFIGITVPKILCNDFFVTLSAHMAASEWYSDVIYMFQSKGLKHPLMESNMLRQFKEEPRFAIWNKLINEYPNDTFFDFAVTAYYPVNEDDNSVCLFPSRLFGSYILENSMLVNVERDTLMLMDDINGFRAELSKKYMKNGHIIYFQLYTTEKTKFFSKQQDYNVTDFNVSDVIYKSKKFEKCASIMKSKWQEMVQSNYGTRMEIRISGEAFKYLLETDAEKLKKIMFTEDFFYAIPSYEVVLYKLLISSVYWNLLENARKITVANVKNESPSYNLFLFLTWGLKGLVRRLEDFSCYRPLLKNLELELCMLINGRLTLPEGALNFRRMEIVLDSEEYFNREELELVSQSIVHLKTVNDVACFIWHTAYKELWQILAQKLSIELKNEICDFFNETNLSSYEICYKSVRSKYSMEERIEYLFNLTNRPLNNEMSDWKKFKFIGVTHTIFSTLQQQHQTILKRELFDVFQNSINSFLPAFKINGKFWIFIKHENEKSIKMSYFSKPKYSK